MKRKILCAVLSVVLALQLLPGSAFAALITEAELPADVVLEAEGTQETSAAATEKQYVPIGDMETATASSYQTGFEPGKVIDGIEDDSDNCWHTPWEAPPLPTFPHWIQVEFKTPQEIDALVYVARKEDGFQFVTEYEVLVSATGEEEDLQTVAEGTWTRAKTATAKFKPVEAMLVRFVAKAKTDSNSSDTYSVSASELKFGLYKEIQGAMDDDIYAVLAPAERVLAYANANLGGGGASGNGVYNADKAAALSEACNTLRGLLNTVPAGPIYTGIEAVQTALDELLESGKAVGEETLTVALPKSCMSAVANTAHEGYGAENAADGDIGTIWHTAWSPDFPFPHSLTVDLGRTLLLETVKITPRQGGSQKITSGEVYIGDDPENLVLAAAFGAAAGSNAVEVPLNYRQGRYLQIKALKSTDPNTAIAEVDVTTYDRGYVAATAAYAEAAQFLLNAKAGEEIGQYPQAEADAFTTALENFSTRLEGQSTNSECYALTDEIKAARDNFADKVNRYSKDDLLEAITSGEAMLDSITNVDDKALLTTAIRTAEAVANSEASTAAEFHGATVALRNTLDALEAADADSYDLSGKWDFYMGAFIPSSTSFGDTVTLPGTLDENQKGRVNTFKDPRRFSRYYEYEGPATYQRQVFVPNSWGGREIVLYMERSRETRVWVNGEEVASPNASIMATAQTYDLTAKIDVGTLNTITVVVDNSYPTTPRDAILYSSMATMETQTNWNGIVGRFELQISPLVNIEDLRVYPNRDLKTATVQVDIKNGSDGEFTGAVTLQAAGLEPRVISAAVPAGKTLTVSINDYAMGGTVRLWGEFEQNLYTMTATLPNHDSMSEQFGMRAFGVDSDTRQLVNNGDKVFLRNEANCGVFPLTGYAPMDKEDWREFLQTYQSYGLNSVRFHSWCPPEAAFAAADELGMFLQPELSCWDPSNMFDGPVEKTYYAKEAHAIVKAYANHPSFVMFTFGNELVFAGGGYEFADTLLSDLKVQDPTRLYSFASNAGYGSTAPTGHSDFFTGQVYLGETMRGIYAGMGGFINSSYPATTVNFKTAIDKATKAGYPAFGFEVGQFQVFPDVLGELDGYTGVLDPRNIQLVADRVKDMGIPEESVEKYINASGMLSRIGYRMEIEATLRTEHMSGISLLGIQDFPGQSTALVGMMNSLGDPKPYDFANPEDFAPFFSAEVALLETEKFCWTSDESFTGTLLMANYGPEDLSGEMSYCLTDGELVLYEGTLDWATFRQGHVDSAGEIQIPLAAVSAPAQLKLTIGVGAVTNAYDLWVYPAEERAPEGEVYVTEFLDGEALYLLENGGKVLLTPKANKTTLPQSITGTFTTAFWSSQFVSESQPGSMGLLMDPEHPVFAGFPTEYHSNYQWWNMAKWGRPMILESFTQEDGTKIQPLVQVIDSFATLRTMGLLYEAKVGEGKLMVSSMGLDQKQAQYPEARALRNSILNYMNSDAFDPAFEVSAEKVQATVVGSAVSTRPNLAENTYGGTILLGENTTTCTEGYDNNPQDRKLELNDGRVDVETSSRSWTDWSASGSYPHDAEITAKLGKAYTVDVVVLPFFEDSGCKAPANITVQAWDGEAFIDVSNPSKTTGFVKGNNTITFDSVSTSQVRLVMEHANKMGIAFSEFIVYEKTVPPTAITVLPASGITTLNVGETLQMELAFQPEEANDTDVYWRLTDSEGNKSTIASITMGGVLTAKSAGKVVVKAELRSDRNVFGRAEITVLSSENGTTSSPSNTTTNTEKNPDGSTTKTVTDKKTGAVIETTTYPDGVKIVAVTPKDGKTVIEVTVPANKPSVTVTIPTAKKPTLGEVAVIVKPDGTREIIKTSVATGDGMRVTLSEGARLEIVDNGKAFSDVAGDHWAAGAVQFAISRALFNGTGGDSFAPAADMSRAMLLTVLARLDGQDTTTGERWSSVGAAWAKENGISDGADPDSAISREQLAVMLYRYAKAEKVEGNLADFADADNISVWAAEAMAWAVRSGIITGKSGALDPQGTATRAEVAAMLQRFVERTATK